MISLFKLRIHRCNYDQFKRALSTSQLKEYYALLNVDRSSTKQQIKDSFLRLSKVYHPDNKITGSHNKFVKLKEAYDAIKDGPPATSQSYSTATSSNPYSNYDEYEDLSHRAHYRERSRAYQRTYDQYYGRSSAEAGFGGPYSKSSTPWEDLMKEKEYKRKKYYGYDRPRFKPLVSITLILSGLAWIVIGSFVNEIWRINSDARARMYSGNLQEFKEYQEYLRRREAARERLPNKPRYGYYVSKEAKKREKETEEKEAVAATTAMSGKNNVDSSSNLDETNSSSNSKRSTPIEVPPEPIVEEELTNLVDTDATTDRLVA